jgi:hypothetical protein
MIMKKIFLAAITSLALCSYSYAQDDEDEYEEEDSTESVAPAPAVEEEEEEAPAPVKKEKKKDKKKKKKSGEGDEPFFGISIGIDQNDIIDFEPNFFVGRYSYIGLMFKLTPEMMITGKIGFAHHGETTYEADKVSVKAKDNYTAFLLGAQFDYFLPTPLLPTSVSAGIMYANGGEMGGFSEEDIERAMNNPEAEMPDGDATVTNSALVFDVMFNVHANLTDNLVLTGSVGLGLEMPSITYEIPGVEINERTNQPEEVTNTIEVGRTDIGLKAGIRLGWFFM